MARSNPLPAAPRELPEPTQRAWNDLVAALDARDRQYHKGLIGEEYTVSGTVPASITIDLASIEVTATTHAVAKLLKDLRESGLLDVILK